MAIETEIPNLAGGVTQQAENLRFPAQVDEMVDRIPSIVHGNTDRNGTDYLAEFVGQAFSKSDTLFHPIARDETENYLVVIKNGDLKVFDGETAEEKVVNFPDGKAYLTTVNDARESFNALTISDTTFITNNTVETQISHDLVTPPVTTESIVFIKQGAYKTDYSFTSDVGLAPVATIDAAFSWERTSGPAPVNTWTVGTAVVNYKGAGYTTAPDIIAVCLNITTGEEMRRVTASVTANIANGEVQSLNILNTIGVHAAFTLVALEVDAPDDPPAGGEPVTTTAKHTTHATDNQFIRTGIIASNLCRSINSTFPDYTATRRDNIISVKRTDGAPYNASVSDSIGDSAMNLLKESVEGIHVLPTSCYNGFKLKVIGDIETEADDYYVQFETTNGGDFGNGAWVETLGFQQVFQFDTTTMPHILTREANGDFTFKQAPWADRCSGDALTNPFPSFVGQAIENFYFTRGRLGFLSGSNTVWSESDQPYNFFRTTVTNSLATRPIDIEITGTAVSKLEYALASEENILLFSKEAQHVLDLSGGFAFDTVSLSQATRTELSVSCEPLTFNADAFFCYPRGEYAGIKQFTVEPDTLRLKAFDVSEHVPSYIVGSPTNLTALTSENMLLIQSDSYSGCYFYRFIDRNRERVQSAYGKLNFGGTLLFSYVLDSLVYLVIDREGDMVLERWNPSVGNLAAGEAVHTILDSKITELDVVSNTLDVPTQITTITLPYKVKIGEPVFLCGRGAAAGTVLAQGVGDGTASIAVAGDYTAASFYIGVGFTSYVDLSRPIMTQQVSGTRAVTGGKFQVLNGRITVNDARPFNVEVKLKHRDSYTYTLRAEDLRQIEEVPVATMDGDYRFAVYAKSDDVDVVLSNPTPFPCSWLSLAWEGRFQKRNQAS